MSQNLRANSDKKTSKRPAINPKLAASLGSLEVQLEQELTRYRRSRIVNRRPNNFSVSAATNPESVNPESVNQESVNKIYSSASKLLNAPDPNLNEENKTSKIEDISQATQLQEPKTSFQDDLALDQETQEDISTGSLPVPPPPPLESNPSDLIAAQTAETRKVDPQEVAKYIQANDNQQDNYSTSSIEEITDTQSPQSSIIPAAKLQTKEEETVLQTNNSEISKQPPNDYLESSEALLRSLSEEKNETSPTPKKSKGGLFSPLGIIGLILLILSALGLLVYAVVNPEKMPQFGTAKENQGSDLASGGNTKNVNQPQVTTPLPKNPNLAQKEFPTINSPNDVVGLKPKEKAKPSPQPENPPQPPVIPQIESQIESQIPQTTQPNTQSDEDIKPGADGFYRVIIDNEGNQAYAKARNVVPDAYVSDDKKFIYLGALKSKERAKRLLSELEAKGIKARIQ